MEGYKTSVTPGKMTGDVPFFCTFDEILDIEKVIGNLRNPNAYSKEHSGGRLFVADKPPKREKVRYVRREEGKPLLKPMQKPVELPIRAIENSSQPGEVVLDFFGGSGSTLMGADITGRCCFTTELDPTYCDVIISRYVAHTGSIGVTCVRDGQETPHIDLVRDWVRENGREEVNAMKTPVVVIKKIVKDKGRNKPWQTLIASRGSAWMAKAQKPSKRSGSIAPWDPKDRNEKWLNHWGKVKL